MSEIGDYLKAARKAKRLTLREAAGLAGISNGYLSQLETGDRAVPHPMLLRKLALVYEVPMLEILRIAGYADEAEVGDSEEEEVNRAFEFVMADARFQAGTRVKEGLSMDAKRYIIETYEKVTGARLLGLR